MHFRSHFFGDGMRIDGILDHRRPWCLLSTALCTISAACWRTWTAEVSAVLGFV